MVLRYQHGHRLWSRPQAFMWLLVSAWATSINTHPDCGETTVIWGFSTPLSPIDRSYGQNNKQRNSGIKWCHMLNAPKRVLQNILPKHQLMYVLFSSSWKDYILEHKANLKKYRKIEIVLCFLSDFNTIKQNKSKLISSKYKTSWLLSNSLLNYERVK